MIHAAIACRRSGRHRWGGECASGAGSSDLRFAILVSFKDYKGLTHGELNHEKPSLNVQYTDCSDHPIEDVLRITVATNDLNLSCPYG